MRKSLSPFGGTYCVWINILRLKKTEETFNEIISSFSYLYKKYKLLFLSSQRVYYGLFETIHPNKADVIVFFPQSNYFVGFVSLAVGDNAVQIQREDVYSTAVPGERKKAWKLSKCTTQLVCVCGESL